MQSMLWLKEQVIKKPTVKYMSLNEGVRPAPKWHVNMMKSQWRMLWLEEARVCFERGLCLPTLFAKYSFFGEVQPLKQVNFYMF